MKLYIKNIYVYVIIHKVTINIIIKKTNNFI